MLHSMLKANYRFTLGNILMHIFLPVSAANPLPVVQTL